MLIGSPLFDKTVIKRETGDFTITALNNSGNNIYIQNSELNGTPINRAYIHLDEFLSEGELILTMGPEPSRWAQSECPPCWSGTVT